MKYLTAELTDSNQTETQKQDSAGSGRCAQHVAAQGATQEPSKHPQPSLLRGDKPRANCRRALPSQQINSHLSGL